MDIAPDGTPSEVVAWLKSASGQAWSRRNHRPVEYQAAAFADIKEEHYEECEYLPHVFGSEECIFLFCSKARYSPNWKKRKLHEDQGSCYWIEPSLSKLSSPG